MYGTGLMKSNTNSILTSNVHSSWTNWALLKPIVHKPHNKQNNLQIYVEEMNRIHNKKIKMKLEEEKRGLWRIPGSK